MKKIISVVGARPNFIKVAPLHRAFQKYKNEFLNLICHTGQHFDEKMSKIFFSELSLPEPNFYLGVGSGTHAEQTAKIMTSFEKVLSQEKPDLVIVVGDVNSTLACAITAAKMCIPVAHVEAGLRSFDRSMPEEINRIVTDVLSDLLFVSEKSGIKNLKNEGIDENKIFFTGNIMIDSLTYYMNEINNSNILTNFGITKNDYVLCTFHRPSNVDTYEGLYNLIDLLNFISNYKKIIFPVHPRTKQNLIKFGLEKHILKDVYLIDPIGYIDFLSLTKNSFLVITDSGGIQEETTFLGIQCITVRENTERPITVEEGTNHLAGTNITNVKNITLNILNGNIKKGKIPELWDGKTAERIVEIIKNKI